MEPLRCSNPQCPRELARTDGQQLVFGVTIAGTWTVISRVRPTRKNDTIKVICTCGTVRTWRRAEITVDTGARLCYNSAVVAN